MSLTNLFSLRTFSRWTWVSQYQNVSSLDLAEAKDDGGDGNNWGYKTSKASVKSSAPTNQQSVLRAKCPSCRPTNSVSALKGNLTSLLLFHNHHGLGQVPSPIFNDCWSNNFHGPYALSIAQPAAYKH